MTTWKQKDPPDNIDSARSYVDIPPDGFVVTEISRNPYGGYESPAPRAWLDAIVLEVSVFGWSVSMYAAPFPVGTYLAAVGGGWGVSYTAISITPEGGSEEIVVHSNVAKNGWTCNPISWDSGFSPMGYDRLEGPYAPIPAVGDAPYGHTFPAASCHRFSKAGYFQPNTQYTVRVIVAQSYSPAGSMNAVEVPYVPMEERSFIFRTSEVQPPAPPPVAPVISNVSPTAGTPIERSDSLSFDVTDDSGELRRFILEVYFEGLKAHEVAYNGTGSSDGFRPIYAGSSISPISGGFHVVLVREGGWPAQPYVLPDAIDKQGAENA